MTDSRTLMKDLKLSSRRMKHTLGVAEAAKMLAITHFPEIDPEIAEMCGLMHDYTKEYSFEEQTAICKKYNIEVLDEEIENPKLLHAKTAAKIASVKYGFPDYACDAIFYHTTGRADMKPLEIVLYLADYIEKNRDDEGCIKVRDYYYSQMKKEEPEKALAKTLVLSFDVTLRYLLEDKKHICLTTVEARNFYLKLAKSMR